MKDYELVERFTQIVVEECGTTHVASSDELTREKINDIQGRVDSMFDKVYGQLKVEPKVSEAKQCERNGGG